MKTREIPTKLRDLHRRDTVIHEGTRHTVVRNTCETNSFHTLQLQVPGFPVLTIRDADPDFVFTRLGL
jgi:hypothetical protein